MRIYRAAYTLILHKSYTRFTRKRPSVKRCDCSLSPTQGWPEPTMHAYIRCIPYVHVLTTPPWKNFTTVSRVTCHHPLQETILRGGDILYVGMYGTQVFKYRKIIMHTVRYVVYVWFWPTLVSTICRDAHSYLKHTTHTPLSSTLISQAHNTHTHLSSTLISHAHSYLKHTHTSSSHNTHTHLKHTRISRTLISQAHSYLKHTTHTPLKHTHISRTLIS